MSVLIVEDDCDLRDSLVQVLENAGFATHESRSAEEAVNLLLSDRAGVRLILIDQRLPGMSGLKLAGLLAGSEIPVVMMTASSDVETPAGVVALLTKPFELDTLLAVVRRHGRESDRPRSAAI